MGVSLLITHLFDKRMCVSNACNTDFRLFIVLVDELLIHCIYVTGPAKRDQVGTRYTIPQNNTYHEFWVQYLLSVNCKMLLMKLFMDGENFTYIASADL